MVYVYLIYGLSFFILWAILWIYHIKLWQLTIGKNLWMIALFAVTHGLSDWIQMVVLLEKPAGPVLQSISLVLLVVSFAFLMLFGIATIAGKRTRLQLLPILLLMTAVLLVTIISRNFSIGEIAARYFLGIPGGLLTFSALLLLLRTDAAPAKKDKIAFAKDMRWTAWSFLAYSFLSGVIVPEAGFFPASIFNYRVFESAIGAPIQLFRAACVIVIAFGMARALHGFEVEAERSIREYQGSLERSVEKRTRELSSANEILRRNEIHLTAILDNIPDMAWLKDEQSRFIRVNEPFARSAGMTVQDLIGKTDFDIWPKGLAERYRADDREVMESRVRKQVEEPLVDQDGNPRWIETIKTPIYNDRGVVIGTAGIARDITDRRKALAAIKTEQLFRKSVESSILAGIVAVDLQQRQIYVNPAFCRMVGWTEQELIGAEPPYRYWAPEDIDNINQAFQETVIGKGRPEGYELRFLKRSGERFDVFVQSSLLMDGQQNAIGWLASVYDITARKKQEQALAESEERHRLLFETMHQGVIYHNAEGKIISLNKATESILGMDRSMLLGRVPATLEQTVIREDGTPLPPMERPSMEVLRTGRAVRDAIFGVFNPREKEYRWIIADAIPLFRAGETRPYRIYTLFYDITDRRRAEEALLESEKRMQLVMDTVPALISYVGNDLRYRFVNRQYEKWWDRPASEIVGKHIKDVLGAERYKAVEEQIQKALQGERLTYEWIVPRNGEQRYVHVDYVPYIGENQELLGFVVQVNDITQQKMIEEQLRKGKELSDALNSIDKTIHSTLDFDTIAEQVTEKAAQAIGADSAVVYMRENGGWTVRYVYGLPKSIIGGCLSGEEIRFSVIATEEKRTIVINDVAQDGLVKDCKTIKEYGITSLLDVPLIADQNFVGHFALHYHDPKKKFTDTEVDFINKAASSLVLALKNARLFEVQKQTEQKLQKINERLSSVLESITEAYYALDQDWKIIEINKEAEKILGPSKDVIGKVYWEQFPGNIGSEIDRQYHRAVEKRNPVHFEAISSINNRWYELHAYPRGERLEIYFTDITERKKVEQELRDLNRDFMIFLENTTDFVYFKDNNSRFRFCSQTVANITGYDSWRDMIGKHDLEVFPEDAAKIYYEEEFPIFQKGIPLLNKVDPFYDAQGRRGWVSTNKWPVFDEENRVIGIFGISRDITEHKKMEEDIRHMAQHDALTGLPNRLLFADILKVERAQARRNRKKIAVLFLDLDRFKEINDTLGHEAGDQLLKEVSTRLTRSIRESDSVARIGGDEFNVLLADISNVETVSDVVQKIVDAFQPPFTAAGQEFPVTTSIGISIYPDDSKSIDTLLRYADIAMYYAKEQGRNNFQFYNPAINSRSLERIKLEGMLRQTIERGELVVYYQPLVNIRSQRIVSAEALVRWVHPEHGILKPDEFIPAAEDTGFITAIDEYVLRHACLDIKAWVAAGLRPVGVTVNLSAREFQNPDLTRKIAGILEETGAQADYLTIEITESMAMSNIDLTVSRLRELTGMGMHVAIDDFGTGYSSLNHLKRLPLDKLKIDKSFIRDITSDADDRTIIKAVTQMAHTMKLKVTAEGVETEDQLESLKALDCDEAQGYLFSSPLSAEQFGEMIGAGK